MYKGRCLCGEVRFQITGPIKDIVYCHCSECRKVQGSAFATNGMVAANEFEFVSGSDSLCRYRSSAKKEKLFCKHCGSPIMSKNDDEPSLIRIRLGTIEGEVKERPSCHIYVGSKANWYEINDDLPQFETVPTTSG